MNAERLCHELGASLLRAIVLPEGAGQKIRAVVVGGPSEELAGVRGDIVLAVGAASAAERERIVSAAHAAGAAAVVVKGREPAGEELRARAREAGLALLATDPEVSWGRLYELIGSAISPGRAAELLPSGTAASGDLFTLADATATATGAPVTIEDPGWQVLAFSREGQDVDDVRVATILGRRVPGRWAAQLREQAELDGVLASGEPGVIEVPGMAPRRVIAIRSGGVLLGSIWLAGATDAGADDVLREAAATAALQLMRRRAEKELEYATRSAAVIDLLRTGELSARAAAETGLRAADSFVVLAVELAGGGERDLAAHDQLADLLAAHLLAFRRRAANVVLDGRGYVVAACADEADAEILLGRLQDGLTRARRTVGSDLVAGLGVLAATPAALPDARATADRALELGGSPGRVVPFDEVRAAALVEDVGAFVAARRDGASRALRQLIEHDRDHGTELTTTLRVVLELFGDTALAAKRLHVHANTVRYRLRQASELTGLRLSDGTDRLALELELRALERERGDL